MGPLSSNNIIVYESIFSQCPSFQPLESITKLYLWFSKIFRGQKKWNISSKWVKWMEDLSTQTPTRNFSSNTSKNQSSLTNPSLDRTSLGFQLKISHSLLDSPPPSTTSNLKVIKVVKVLSLIKIIPPSKLNVLRYFSSP